MDYLINPEDSYAQRRQLFKNIWEAAMQLDENVDIMNKTKVIKTLRLDEVDRNASIKKKKLRLRHLRAVCNKILDFCDRQEADNNLFNEMMKAGCQGPTHHTPDPKFKKAKTLEMKKKIKNIDSIFSSKGKSPATATKSDRKQEIVTNYTTKMSRNTSPNKIKRITISDTVPVKVSKIPHNTRTPQKADRDFVKKKSKKKKQSQTQLALLQ